MKKFFKALALVLALTLVLGTIPASAAVDADKVRKEKTLYVDGTKGFKTVDGEQQFSLLKARTTYWKLLKIKKAEAKQLGVTAESSAPEIVKTNDESMGVHAYAIGEATITISDGEKLYKVVVTAKKSAETVTFGRDFADTEKPFYAGKTYEISLPRTVNKVKLDTDERRLVIKNEKGEVATAEEVVVTADETAPRLWTVKFLKAGKFTVIGEAFQSKKYDGTTASFEAAIEVKTPELADIKQTSVNGFQLTFDGDANAVDDFKPQEIYYKVADSVVPFSLLKEVKIDEEDATKVNVTMFANFEGGKEYFVKVGDVIKSFVACGTSAKDIKEFILKTATVAYGDFRNIEYAYLNAEGIDITSANPTVVPTFELTSNNTNEVVVAGTQIYFYEKGKTATVKGTVTTDYGNEANGYQPTVLTCSGTIISTDQNQATFLGVVYTFDNAKVYTKDNIKDSLNVHDYPIGDSNELKIFFKYRNAANTADEYKTMGEEGISSVKVADENFAAVTGNANMLGANSSVKLTGIKTGPVQLLLYKKNTTTGADEAVAAIPVTIAAKRAVSSIVLSADKNTLNTDYADDTVVLTLTVKDQYQDGINVDTRLFAQSEPTEKNVGTFTVTPIFTPTDKAGVYTATLKASEFAFVSGKSEGSVVVAAKVTGDKFSNNIGISVADKNGATIAYIPTVDKSTLDTTVAKNDTDLSVAKFTVDKSAGGYNAGKYDSLVFVGKSDFNNKIAVAGATKDEYAFTLSRNGAMLETTDFDKSNIAVAATGASITAVTGTSIDAKLNKALDGSYTFTVYKIGAIEAKDGKNYTTYSIIGSRTIVISDAQPKATVEKKSDVTTATSAATWASKATIIDETLTVKYNGNTVVAAKAENGLQIVDADIIESTDTSFYINTVTIRLTNAKLNGYIDITAEVGKLINGSKK